VLQKANSGCLELESGLESGGLVNATSKKRDTHVIATALTLPSQNLFAPAVPRLSSLATLAADI
jgi:hypothetical protein